MQHAIGDEIERITSLVEKSGDLTDPLLIDPLFAVDLQILQQAAGIHPEIVYGPVHQNVVRRPARLQNRLAAGDVVVQKGHVAPY